MNSRRNNYVRYMGYDFHVDEEESSLQAFIDPQACDTEWWLEIVCTDDEAPDGFDPAHIEGPTFYFKKPWRELAGEVFHCVREQNQGELSLADGLGGIYTGTHELLNNHTIQFTARDGNCFSVRWNCTAQQLASDEPAPIQVTADIPFTCVTVVSREPISVEQANEFLGNSFNLNELEEPRFETTPHHTSAIYLVKDIKN